MFQQNAEDEAFFKKTRQNNHPPSTIKYVFGSDGNPLFISRRVSTFGRRLRVLSVNRGIMAACVAVETVFHVQADFEALVEKRDRAAQAVSLLEALPGAALIKHRCARTRRLELDEEAIVMQ